MRMKHTPDALLVVAALGIAFAVKSHFSRATADELTWILAPTAWLTSVFLDRDFVRLPDAGYLSEELSILVTPACAGVNFLVVAFTVLALGFGRRFGTSGAKATWLVVSGALAYTFAVAVNGARIALSVHFSHVAARELGLSFQEAHRLLGVATYLGGLMTLVLAAEAAFGRYSSHRRDGARREPSRRAGRTLALALVAYVGVTLLVPLARGAARSPEYWDHARFVGGAALAFALVTFVVFAFVTRIHALLRARGFRPRNAMTGSFSSANGVSGGAPAGAEIGSMEMRSGDALGGLQLGSSGFSGMFRGG